MNPVLPPPRPVHVDNPVEVLLTARNPEQVRWHFARLRRARLYGWTQDTNYKGSKGGKWVGTDEDAGKVRYQANKPGSGRGGKKEPGGEKGSGGGGKPSPKESHADIVQHLRDVLSGEGEEADALFAKLQDRLQGMSPSERKKAAAKLEAVLGGKPTKEKAPAKRATKQPAEKKPAAGKQASEADTFEATKRAWSELTKEGNVNIPELYDAVAEQIPGLTLPEFHKMLLQWKKDDLITLQLNGHRDAFPRSNEGIEGQKGLYFFVQLRGDPKDLKLPAGRDKPAQPAKEAPAKTPAKRQPAAAKKKPQKGDVNEKGQVFDGRWWRRPEGEKPAPKARAKKAAAEKLGGQYDDMDREEIHKSLRKGNLNRQLDQGESLADVLNPRGYKGFPDGIDVDGVTVATVNAVRKAAESSNASPTIRGIFDSIKKSYPGITLDQFQQTLTELHRQKKIELGAYAQSLATIPDEHIRHVFPLDGEVKQYIRLGQNAGEVPDTKKARAKKAAAEKQPAAKPGKIADKPTPGKVSGATPEQLGKAIKEVANMLKGFPEYRDGLIDMGAFYTELQDRIPDLTLEQFHNLMWQLSRDYQVELHVLNEVQRASKSEKDHALWDNDRMYNYVRIKDKDAPLVPSKPVDAEKKFKTRSEYEEELKPKPAEIGVPPSAVPGSPVHEPPRLPQPPRS